MHPNGPHPRGSDHRNGSACPSAEKLRILAAESARAGDEHLLGCPACAARVERLRADERLFTDLRAAVGCERPRGVSIPGYEIASEIDGGGQARVYRAVQVSTRRVLALKVLAGGRGAPARERWRFEREVAVAARLRHPGIVTIFDSGVADCGIWYAMELVEGRRLDRWLEDERPTLSERERVFLALCEAVAHAHRAGIVHRDLKPANVLVDRDGRPRVLDFGIAAAVGEALRVTLAGEFLGTAAYAAPEQARGGDAPVDTRTDVHALGILLYELATGALPWDPTGSTAEVLARVAHAPPADPRDLARGVDADLRTILLTALCKDPEERYPSVEALARDVAHHLAREPIEARPRGLAYVARKALARHPVRAALAALVLAAAVAGGVLFVRERVRTADERARAQVAQALLDELLGAAGPGRLGREATVLEALRHLSARFDDVLAGAPSVRAAVDRRIGETYWRLLMLPEAEEHLRAALDAARAGGEPLEIAHAAHLLGRALADAGRREAIHLQQEALALRRAALGAGDPLVAEAELGLAVALAATGDASELARAETLALRAQERIPAARGAAGAAEARLWLAAILARRGRTDAGALLNDAVVELAREAADDPLVLQGIATYAAWLEGRGRARDAAEGLAHFEEKAEALFTGPRVEMAFLHHARVQRRWGAAGIAERLVRTALARQLEAIAADAPDADEARALAARLREPGEEPPPDAAALRLLAGVEGDHLCLLDSWGQELAFAVRAAGRAAEAEPLLAQAIRLPCQFYGEACSTRVGSLLALAALLEERGARAEAVPHLREALAVASAWKRDTSGYAAEARAALARCTDRTPDSEPR